MPFRHDSCTLSLPQDPPHLRSAVAISLSLLIGVSMSLVITFIKRLNHVNVLRSTRSYKENRLRCEECIILKREHRMDGRNDTAEVFIVC